MKKHISAFTNEKISSFRRHLLTGFLLVLPTAATIWVMIRSIDFIGAPFGHFLSWITNDKFSGTIETILGFLIAIATLTFIGYTARYFVSKSVIKVIENWMTKLPVFNSIYIAIRQIIESFSLKQKKAFKSVVMLEYPRKGLYSLGFLTNENTQGITYKDKNLGEGMLSIFIPTTPNPTSGYFIMAPQNEVKILEISVEEAIKLIISGGIISQKKEIK